MQRACACSGVRTASVEVVATSTLAAYVSYTDLGTPVLSGLNTSNDVEAFAGVVAEPADFEAVFRAEFQTILGALGDYGDVGAEAVEVVALAHGLTGTAKMNDAVIVRKNPDTGQTVEIPVRLKDIFNRKVADVRMLPNDIMIVPDSTTKKILAKGAQAAITIGSGVAIYRNE